MKRICSQHGCQFSNDFHPRICPICNNPQTNAEEPQANGPVELHKKHKGGGWYDVIKNDGTAVNTRSLREGQADMLIAENGGPF